MDVKVSIIVPVYNAAPYLRRCLVSLVNQDLADNFEIILVYDDSMDNSLEICEEFQKKYDCVRVYHNENKGLSSARNKGISVAKGQYYVHVDADDYVELNYCSKMLNAMELHNVDLVLCKFIHVYNNAKTLASVVLQNISDDNTGRVLNRQEFLQTYSKDELLHSVAVQMHKAEIIKTKGIYFPDGLSHGDVHVSAKLFTQCDSFYILPEHLYYYYHRKNSISSKQFNDYRDITNMFLQYSLCIEYITDFITKTPDDVIKKKIAYLTEVVCWIYLQYQFHNFFALSTSEAIHNKESSYCLFGASSGIVDYIDSLQRDCDNLFIVDNNKALQGTKYNGKYPIYSPEILKTKPVTKIFVTSIFLPEIVMQLQDMGVIGSVADVMPYSGKTETEKSFCKGFEYLFSVLKYGKVDLNEQDSR